VAPEPTDLARLVRHSVESAQVQADNAGITLEVGLPDTLIAQADPVKMSQVADNLISNAIKYTPAGGTVTVSAAQAGDCAELIVTDTGIGISADEQRKLFTNFYRTEHVRRAAIPGTGLGLAITQGLIRAHGGDITVTSQKGEGSTFTVSLPVEGPAMHTPADASTSPL
jgi:two-component system phosphate regulon sensor histidine kinase PhoR